MQHALVRSTCLLTTLLLFALTTKAQTYCLPGFQMACFYGDKITRVTFAGIDHQEDVCDVDADGKKDFTSTVPAAQVTAGSTYTLTVTFSVNSSVGAYAWLDFNRDGTFQATEAFNLGTRTSNGTLSVNIPVPAGATTGTSRLRIMNRKNNVNPAPGPGDACHSISNYRGQMKDYAVTITGGSSLPVTLGTFHAAATGAYVALDWTTDTERDNDFFVLERSRDAENWEQIAQPDAAGNSTAPHTYRFDDDAPFSGTVYYRLSQQDVNGEKTLLDTRSVVVTEEHATVYPNPFTDGVTVVSTERHAEVQLFDNCRQLHLSHIIEAPGALQLDTKTLSPGVYLLIYRTQQENRCFRIVKQ